ncbi:hypothetical protein [Parasulfuritortus cantonensis]|uniref:hypothetical protein n=1 Tax=Parasulfuritortus cantonensis TaxID=2528202 RepID=UPI001F0DFBDD|nr:hypothetical protein [Parasulfuritortus cantonensis]
MTQRRDGLAALGWDDWFDGRARCPATDAVARVAATVLAAQLAEIRAAGIAAPVITLSNLTGAGVGTLGQTLQAGRTYCFVGSSGSARAP